MKYWAVKLPKEHRGVYSKKEVIKEKQLLLQGLKGVEVKSFNTNKGQSLEEALKWAGVSGISDRSLSESCVFHMFKICRQSI